MTTDQLDKDVVLVKKYTANATYVDVLEDLIRMCGVSVNRTLLERTLRPINNLTLPSGFSVASRPAAEQVREVMHVLDLRWQIKDGEFVFVGKP